MTSHRGLVADTPQLPPTLWDPLAAWPAGRWWLWAGLAALAICFQGPDFVRSLRPTIHDTRDFFQEWSSARSYFLGGSVYARLPELAEQLLDVRVDRSQFHLEVNAHPPTAILLLMPLAVLDYPDAHLVWNLASLAALAASVWLVVRGLGLPFSVPSCFPLVVLFLLCNPLRQQVNQGQFGGLLSLMVTGIWLAARSGRPLWAGSLLGAAIAIKLYPGFLFLYFVVRREWTVVAAGVISLAALSGVTAAVLGPEAYVSYVRDVLPVVGGFRSVWANASLDGLASKLFDPVPEKNVLTWRITPLWNRPELARVVWGLACAIVVAWIVPVIQRRRSLPESDRAFGLTVTAMLLVSPITWDHYFLVLALPLAVVWQWLPSSGLWRPLFLATVVGLCLDPSVLGQAVLPGGNPPGIADPRHTLTVFSLQCYALLGLLALGGSTARHPTRESERVTQVEPFRATP